MYKGSTPSAVGVLSSIVVIYYPGSRWASGQLAAGEMQLRLKEESLVPN